MDLPPIGDEAAGERLVERLAGSELLAHPDAATLLRVLGSHSPFLADLACREQASLLAVLCDGPGAVVAGAVAGLADAAGLARPALAQALRAAKRIVCLAAAVADIGGLWRLDQVTGALSDLADAALIAAIGHLLAAARASGAWHGEALVVLAMGKLGGRELNFSSDIDLVLLHDPGAGASSVPARVARDLVALLEARDADGYVFRVDLRLRPDPAATPPSVALPAALAYYESLAQTWERAAMIRARPAAGDLALGAGFLDAIRPFVWRKTLDFAAIADLHAMKQRIDQHKGTNAATGPAGYDVKLGHDVKLGRGGIREIEFVAQTLQLVWGGRDPGLRAQRTVEVLRRLVRAGHLGARAAGELIAAYRFLRQVEHRLQMVADRQTHRLPDRAETFEVFARFMGFAGSATFAAVLGRHLGRVARRYGDVFIGEAGPPLQPDAEILAQWGFSAAHVLARPDEWQGGAVRALRHDRARGLLARLLPDLLRALGRQPDPDLAFARFGRFLNRLPAGVQVLSLLDRNRALIERLATVLGAAAPLSEHLASSPSAIEGLFSPLETADPAALLGIRLADARGLEEAIRIVQQTVREEEFAISLATLEGRLDADGAGVRRSALADAALNALLPRALADVARRHGTVPGGGLAVVMLGKAGGREMMAGSDLDLMFVYEHPAEVTQSVGDRPVPASLWFLRAVNAVVAALTAPDAAGALYAIDMRLRPSGNKGPVAVSLTALRHYHRAGGEAWTWERMALTRGRVAAGPEPLRSAVEDAIRVGIAASTIARTDARAMRARLQRDAGPPGPPYALGAGKLRPGGLTDVEFIAEALFLEAGVAPGATRPVGTAPCLLALRYRGLLPADEAMRLVAADRAWRTVLGLLRLMQGRDPADPPSPAPLLAAARQAGLGAVDVADLHASLDALAAWVRAAFVRHLGDPDGEV